MQPAKLSDGVWAVKHGGRLYALVVRRFGDVLVIRDTLHGSSAFIVLPIVKPSVAEDHIPKGYSFRRVLAEILPEMISSAGKIPPYDEHEDLKRFQKLADRHGATQIFF